MQAADLVKYIENPQLLDKQSISELQRLVADFPYFQPAHLLLSIASRKWDATVYQQSLKKTAIVATNREHLFNLVQAAEQEQAEAALTQVPVEEIKKEEVVAKEEARPEPDAVKEEAPAEEKITTGPEKPLITPEQMLEQEIGKQLVNAFVEKEVLKTPELHHIQPQKEPESFGEWLSLLKKNNGPPRQQQTEVREEEKKPVIEKEKAELPANEASQAKKLKHRALIDKIIESSPGVIRAKEEQKFFAADAKAKESLLENEHLVTETLAKIYALQGNVNKAVRAYEILSLKFPQKSAYFATLIQKLKE